MVRHYLCFYRYPSEMVGQHWKDAGDVSLVVLDRWWTEEEMMGFRRLFIKLIQVAVGLVIAAYVVNLIVIGLISSSGGLP